MKIKTLAALAALALAPSLHAFTLDFASLGTLTLPPDINITVGGYGDVRLSAGTDSSGNLTSPSVSAGALQFNDGDVLVITLLSGAVEAINFSAVGLELGENFFVINNSDKTEYRIALAGTDASAGISAITADVVPEPATAALGVIGALGLLVRRRR